MITRRRKQPNIAMCAAFVMLCLTLVSTHFATGLYARYVSTDSASDSARVATFNVDQAFENISCSFDAGIVPGTNTNYVIEVVNESEVAVEFTIDVDNPYHNFPISFLIIDDNAENELPYKMLVGPNNTLGVNLLIKWDQNVIADVNYSGKVEMIEVTLKAAQVD